MGTITKSTILFIIALLAATFTLIYVADHYILTVDFYERSDEPLSGIPGRQADIFEAMQKWIYLFTAIYLLLKISLISLVLYTGLYLSNREIAFSRLFNLTLKAEFIFLIPAVLKILLFRYCYPNGTLVEWHKFYVLSALTIFDHIPSDWYYVLQTLNAFEVTYWFALGLGIHRASEMSFDRSVRIVCLFYLPALVIWVASVTFFALMISPQTG